MSKFLKDTRDHHKAAQKLNRQVFNRLDELQLKEFTECITENVMKKPPNLKLILNEINNDFPKVKRYLEFIRNFNGNPEDIDRLLDISNSLHIKGAGLFFTTQVLAGAHLNEYVVFENNIYETLQHLDIVDMGSKVATGSRYMVINAICKWLYEEKFKERMEESYKFGLQSVHNFLWHYYYHQIKGEGRWWKKDC